MSDSRHDYLIDYQGRFFAESHAALTRMFGSEYQFLGDAEHHSLAGEPITIKLVDARYHSSQVYTTCLMIEFVNESAAVHFKLANSWRMYNHEIVLKGAG